MTIYDPATGLELNADLITRHGIDAARDEARTLADHQAARSICPHYRHAGRYCVECSP